MIVGLFQRAIQKWLPFLVRSLSAASLWLVVAPLLTAYLYHGWMARPSVILERTKSYQMIATDLVSGGVVAACIIVSFLSLMSFADFLRGEWQLRRVRQRNQQQQPQPNNPMDENENPMNVNPIPENPIGNPNPDNNNDVHNNDEALPAVPNDLNENVDNGVWDHMQQVVLQRLSSNNNSAARRLESSKPAETAKDDALQNTTKDSSAQFEELAATRVSALSFDAPGNYSADAEEQDDASTDDDDLDDESWRSIMSESDDDDDDDDDFVAFEVEVDDEDDSEHSDDEVVENERNNDPPGENRQDGVAQRPGIRRRPIPQRNDLPFDGMDPDEPLEMDINIALDELLGVRGPFLVVARNLLWLLAFNAVYLGCFAFVPRTIGMAMCAAIFNTTSSAAAFVAGDDGNQTSDNDLNGTDSQFQFNSSERYTFVNMWNAVDAESVKHNTAFRLHDIATVGLGYFSLAASVVILRFLWFLSQKVRFLHSARGRPGNPLDGDEARAAFEEINRVVDEVVAGNDDDVFDGDHPGIALNVALGMALDAMMAIVKVCVLLFLKMFLLPIVLGIALDASTIAILSSTMEERIVYAGQDIFSFMLLHWVAGITFMLLVTVSVLQLREVAHPDLLAHTIRPQEPQPDLLGNLLHESVGTHSKRMFLSLIIYAFLLIIHIYIPVRFGIRSFMGGTSNPQLQLKFSYVLWPQLQVPLELLFFHICMLALLEKYKNGLGGMQHHWLKFMTKNMGLSDRILPHQVKGFRFLGSRAVFQAGQKLDKFWGLFVRVTDRTNAVVLLRTSLDTFSLSEPSIQCVGETKVDGERLLRCDADYIRLPVRLPGNALRNRSVLIPTSVGKYRLQSDTTNNAIPLIQLWEEVHGEPISRPPEGWDDLGVGGANVQGRWAWGPEKKSTIEVGVAARRPFFDRDRGIAENSFVGFKLFALCLLSWLAASSILFIVAAAPLAIGRALYYILRVPDRWIHDPLAFVMGFGILFRAARKIAKVAMRTDRHSLRQWLGQYRSPPISKAWILFQTLAYIVVLGPIFLGVCYDLAFIKPVNDFSWKAVAIDHVWMNRSTWLTGCILLYLWSDLCVRGVLTRNFALWLFLEDDNADVNENDDELQGPNDGAKLNPTGWQGKHGRAAHFWETLSCIVRGWEWDKVDVDVLLHRGAYPVIVEIQLVLVVSFATRFFFMWCFHSLTDEQHVIVFRCFMLLTVCWRVCRSWKEQLRTLSKAAHKTARDDRYLIGEILMNHGS